MLRRCRMDLHIHSLLSPCAEVEMIPELIVQRAEAMNLDLIAICDHNSAEMTGACAEAAKSSRVKVLAGIECETEEGVHVLALFDGSDQAGVLQEYLWERMPDQPNRPEFFGEQMVVTAEAEFVRYNTRLLSTAADVSVDDLVRTVREMGGLPVAAHADKTYAGLIGVLGFVPPELGLEAVEVSPNITPAQAREQFPSLGTLACIRSSDAHRLDEIGRASSVCWLENRSTEELRLAFCGREGRRLEED